MNDGKEINADMTPLLKRMVVAYGEKKKKNEFVRITKDGTLEVKIVFDLWKTV